MVLRQMQELLAGIYDLPLAHDVYDFLVTDRRELPAGAHAPGPGDEQLFVAPDGDSVRVSLYLDPRVLERLQQHNPVDALHAGNLADYWTALEGVSHFVYLAWNAAHDRPVSLLELETQAEVDKYIGSCWLLRRQSPERFPAEVHSLLFEQTRVDPGVAPERVELYRSASRHAARFCRRIERLLRDSRADAKRDLSAELRRFYRLSDVRKLAHCLK
jgi:hypothetical protein